MCSYERFGARRVSSFPIGVTFLRTFQGCFNLQPHLKLIFASSFFCFKSYLPHPHSTLSHTHVLSHSIPLCVCNNNNSTTQERARDEKVKRGKKKTCNNFLKMETKNGKSAWGRHFYDSQVTGMLRVLCAQIWLCREVHVYCWVELWRREVSAVPQREFNEIRLNIVFFQSCMHQSLSELNEGICESTEIY